MSIATRIAAAALLAAFGVGALTGATPPPDEATVTVVAEDASNTLMSEPHPTADKLKTLHTGDVLTLLNPLPINGPWGEYFHVELDGAEGYISARVVAVTPDISLDDLDEKSLVVAPSAGGGWVGSLSAGSSNAYLYPLTTATLLGQPKIGEELLCGDEFSGNAGVLGAVQFTACEINGQVGFIRSEHVSPLPNLAALDLSGETEAVEETPVYVTPAADKDTKPLATISAGTTVASGLPSGAFTPVEFEGARGWAPTDVLAGVVTWQDKVKGGATKAWDKTKDVASDAKDKVSDAASSAKDKLDEKKEDSGGFFSSIRDIPALILSLILAALTLALAWIRKISFLPLIGSLPLSRLARRGLNVAATIPLLILGSVAPIGSYGWLVWVVLAVGAIVSIGVYRGFSPKLSTAPAAFRTRKAQITAGAAVVVGALVGALVTGFSAWLAPFVTALVALGTAAGYLLSDVTQTDDDTTPEKVDAERPATPDTDTETTAEAVAEPVVDTPEEVR